MEDTIAATQASALSEKERAAPSETLASGEGSKAAEVLADGRAVVDTSAPFESVKEAVDRFGGSAVWNSQLKQRFYPDKDHSVEDFELMKVQEQAAQLEKDLIIKERETLEVQEEFEKTKKTIDNLKIRLHEELSEPSKFLEALTNDPNHPAIEPKVEIAPVNFIHGGMKATGSPGSILVELSQAKTILSRTTSYLTDVQASIESIKFKLQEEKALLEKNMKMLSSKRAKVSSLDEDLKHMNFKLHLTKEAKDHCNGDPVTISIEIKNLNCEREQFKQANEAAKSEILRLASEIEQIKVITKAAEIRWLAAKKMEEAAKATEATALAQIKALINSNSSTEVILPTEEYAILTRKLQEAEETSKKKIECAMLELERASQSKQELIAKLEEAATDAKTSKKFLKEAMNRADAANLEKLAIEETLRKWRSENGQRRRYIHNSKFKNSYPGHQKRDPRMLDLNGLNLANDDQKNRLKHTLSIGEILSRKLIGPGDDDYNTGIYERSNEKVKVSLGQILNRRAEVLSPRNGCGSARKQHLKKRKRFGIILFSHLLKNEKLKRKKTKKNKKRKQLSSGGGQYSMGESI